MFLLSACGGGGGGGSAIPKTGPTANPQSSGTPTAPPTGATPTPSPSGSGHPSPTPTAPPTGPTPTPTPTGIGFQKIQHIIVVMQENRSVDNLFNGFPGANTQNYGTDIHGNKIMLKSESLVSADMGHSHYDFLTDCNYPSQVPTIWQTASCQMNNFPYDGSSSPDGSNAFFYVNPQYTQPYWQMAQTFTFGDNMFERNTGPSFPSHQYMIAAQSADADENPNGADDTGKWGCAGNSSVAQLSSVNIFQDAGTTHPAFPIILSPTASTTPESAGNTTPRPTVRRAIFGQRSRR